MCGVPLPVDQPTTDSRSLQMGGSDQWGNMINGVDLGRKMEGAELFALTAPLVTTGPPGRLVQ